MDVAQDDRGGQQDSPREHTVPVVRRGAFPTPESEIAAASAFQPPDVTQDDDGEKGRPAAREEKE